MKKLKITKMNGSGNDFIIIDNRSDLLKGVSLPELVRTLCRRREAVGADGLILIENSIVADFRWHFFNSDGSEAELCGNGGRCVARFAFLNGIAKEKLAFETMAGVIQAEVTGQRVKLQLPSPTDLKLNQEISVDGRNYLMGSITIGVPHAVLLIEDIDHAPVIDLGRKIRFHQAFQPGGANVNFVYIIDGSHLNIRTYERGVEDETLACGTGAVASALITAALQHVTSPVEVKTRGNEILSIYFQKNNDLSFSHVYLEGDTCLVFEGTLGEDICKKC
jgi:diaminopimelate epimerase